MKCLTLCVALSLVPLCVPVEAQRAVPTPIADSVARVMATPSHWPDRGIFAPPDEPVTARQPLPTGRVRITAAAGIELSTLMQLVLGSATETVRWEVVAEDGDTVTARVGLQPPSTVLRSGHRVEGVISEAGTALLTITTPTGSPLSFLDSSWLGTSGVKGAAAEAAVHCGEF